MFCCASLMCRSLWAHIVIFSGMMRTKQKINVFRIWKLHLRRDAATVCKGIRPDGITSVLKTINDQAIREQAIANCFMAPVVVRCLLMRTLECDSRCRSHNSGAFRARASTPSDVMRSDRVLQHNRHVVAKNGERSVLLRRTTFHVTHY